jgi:flagellar biosynthesis protein FlhA
LDSLPGKQMAIEAELDSEIITAEEAKIRKDELQKEVDLFGSFDVCSKIFSKIGKIITISLICIIMLFLIINGLKIFEIDNKYIIAIIIYGIVSELLLILVPLFTFRIIINNNSKTLTKH